MSTDHTAAAETYGRWLTDQLERHGYDLGPRGGGRTRFAERAGVSPQALGRWLRGVERPTTRAIERVAKALGEPITPMLAMCGYIEPNEAPAGPSATTQRQALEVLGVHDPAKQEAVLAIIRALVGGP